MRNPRAFLPAPVGNAGTGAKARTGVSQAQVSQRSKVDNTGAGVRDRHITRIKKSELKIILYPTFRILFSVFDAC